MWSSTQAVRRLPRGIELSAYRIVQEALTNVRKHAPGARRACRDSPSRPRFGHRGRERSRDHERLRVAYPLGTGSGLVGARERVTLYGGWLDAAPRRDGGFVVRAHIPGRDRRMIRVLIADDQALVRGGFRSMLETRARTSTSWARPATAREAIEQAAAAAPDVVLMDVRMPRDGRDRGDPRPPRRRRGLRGADAHHVRPRRLRLRGDEGRRQRLHAEGRAARRQLADAIRTVRAATRCSHRPLPAG